MKAPTKANNQGLGLILGLICPFLGFYIYGTGWALFHGRTFSYFYHYVFVGTPQFQSAIISLSILINLLPFYIFIRTQRLKSAKGVLASLFVYMPVVIYLKFFV